MNVKKATVISLVVVLCLSGVSCGNSETVKTDTYSESTEERTLFTETAIVEDKALTEESAIETTTESAVDTTVKTTYTSEEMSGGENGNADDGSTGGSSGSWEADVDLSVQNAYFEANLSWFRVYENGIGADYSLRDTRKFDEFTDEHHLNQFGDFMKIEGEAYNGYLTEAFGFSGQAYWLRGEGSQKCFIETNDANEITAIAFTNVSSYYGMQFDCVCPYSHCDTTEDVGKFQSSLVNGDSKKPYMYESGDGNCTIMTFNDGKYSLSLEIVYNPDGVEDTYALKTVMISTNTHERVQGG